MKASLLSFPAGLVVGVVYSLLGVRSPAPPVVALVGLLGILLGEQVVPVAGLLLAREPAKLSTIGSNCARHLFGALPGSEPGAAPLAVPVNPSLPPEQTL